MENKIKVMVDKRMELIGICLRLSDYRNKFPFLVKTFNNFNYHREAEEYFEKYKNHNAIKILNKIIEELNFAYDVPFFLMTYVDDNWNFNGQNRPPYSTRLKNSPLVLEFFDELKDFVKVSKFEEFFKEHKSLYKNEIEGFNRAVSLDDVIPYMQGLFHQDFKDKKFLVILALLSTGGGFGDNDFDRSEVYCIESKRHNLGENTARNRSHYLHEFCHSVINPITRKNFDKIEKINIPSEEVEKLKRSAYGELEYIVNEYIIRAIQVCYIKDSGEDETDFVNMNENLGFNKKVLLNLADRLEKFKENGTNFEKEYLYIANIIPRTFAEINKEKTLWI